MAQETLTLRVIHNERWFEPCLWLAKIGVPSGIVAWLYVKLSFRFEVE